MRPLQGGSKSAHAERRSSQIIIAPLQVSVLVLKRPLFPPSCHADRGDVFGVQSGVRVGLAQVCSPSGSCLWTVALEQS
jgi:hypothetical protein